MYLAPHHIVSNLLYLARFLVKHGADVILADRTGSTPLRWAALQLFRENVELTRVLVEYGANATTQDNRGWTPLLGVSYDGSLDLAGFLIAWCRCDNPGLARVSFTL